MHEVQMYSPSQKTWETVDKYAGNSAGYKSACRRYAELLIDRGQFREVRLTVTIGQGAPVVVTANTVRGFEV